MRIDILTLFPEMFRGPFDESILRRAQDKSLVQINIHDLRRWAKDKRKTVDDRPFGGGVGMVLRVDIIDRALRDLKSRVAPPAKPLATHGKSLESKVILLDATGETFNQKKAREFAKCEHLLIIAGHYEGVDHRVHEHLVDEVVSIGDYVLTGGELPAMVVTDAIVRLIPGVLEKPEATEIESFSSEGKLEFPQYTRPEEYNGWRAPKVLLSGNHREIEKWKQENSSPKKLLNR